MFLNNGNVSPAIGAVTLRSGQTVIVIIAEVRSHTGHRQSIVRKSHAGLKRYLFERSVAAIVKQEVRHVVVRNKNVRQAVAIIVSKSGGSLRGPMCPARPAFTVTSARKSHRRRFR